MFFPVLKNRSKSTVELHNVIQTLLCTHSVFCSLGKHIIKYARFFFFMGNIRTEQTQAFAATEIPAFVHRAGTVVWNDPNGLRKYSKSKLGHSSVIDQILCLHEVLARFSAWHLQLNQGRYSVGNNNCQSLKLRDFELRWV